MLKSNELYLSLWDRFRKDGDKESLSVIYFDFYDLLFNYGLKHTRDRQLVEDSIQTLFFNLLKSGKSLGMVNNLSGYLLKSFRNQLKNNLIKQSRLELVEINEEFDFFANPEQDIIDKEQSDYINKIIRHCIRNLTSKQREILFLRFNCKLSYEEISLILDLTIESCHTTVYRTIRAIKEMADKIFDGGKNMLLELRRK